jgi:UDP-N-acetylmuramoyl-tripeptide--D-alanyl-D-alanine ligase
MNEPLWTSAELAATCGGMGAQPWYADGVQTDSREVLPGDLFVALRGDAMNGHDFVGDAFARGAVAALVSEAVDGFDVSDERLVHVPDSLEALRLMARQARDRAPAIIIAVTGSAGKTSIVQALRQALERVDNTHASIKSFNNHVGVPLSLARMPRESRFGVFELGMSGPGEIRRSAALAAPDVAIVSTIGAAHVAAFDDVAAIARTKAEIFGGLRKGGKAIINMDTAEASILLAAAKAAGADVISVSVTGDADVRPLRVMEHHNCTCLTADVAGTTITYKVGQPGREWVTNSLLVLAAIQAVGADLGHAALALAGLQAEPGRGQAHRLRFGQMAVTLLDDSYNANPLSMRAALRRLSLVPLGRFGRRIAVLADMQELGEQSQALHLALADDLRAFGVSRVYALGDGMTAAAKAAGADCVACADVAGLTENLLKDMRDGDAVMAKGANSAGLARVVEALVGASDPDHGRDHDPAAGGLYAL